jgi:hypothetical protein
VFIDRLTPEELDQFAAIAGKILNGLRGHVARLTASRGRKRGRTRTTLRPPSPQCLRHSVTRESCERPQHKHQPAQHVRRVVNIRSCRMERIRSTGVATCQLSSTTVEDQAGNWCPLERLDHHAAARLARRVGDHARRRLAGDPAPRG